MEHFFFGTLSNFMLWLIIMAGFIARYLLVAGGAYFVFYMLIYRKWWSRKVQQVNPEKKKMLMEISWSFSTFIIFAFNGLFIAWLNRKGFTLMYENISDMGLTWFFVSIFLMLLLHDTWFYWSHRFMHWKPVFKIAHRVHHLSHTPTPWTSFSFHPVEAVIEAMILPLIVITIPSHVGAILVFLFIMTLMNVSGHLGFELFPKKFSKSFWFRIVNCTTHHDMHHRLTKGNYGLYFNIWDRIMGTNHSKYEETFDAIHGRASKNS